MKVIFIDRDGDEHEVNAKIGDSLLEVAKEYDIDLEGMYMYMFACTYIYTCIHCSAVLVNYSRTSVKGHSEIRTPLY